MLYPYANAGDLSEQQAIREQLDLMRAVEDLDFDLRGAVRLRPAFWDGAGPQSICGFTDILCWTRLRGLEICIAKPGRNHDSP